MKKKIAVFLDRDGTINKEVSYLKDEIDLKLLPDASCAISLLNKERIKAIIVTNQAGIARGFFSEVKLKEINSKLLNMLLKNNAKIDAIYYCPHHPDIANERYGIKCNCRKPGTLMLESAAKDLDFNLSDSYIIGDKISDIKAGQNASIKNILVLTGYGKDEIIKIKKEKYKKPDFVASDILEAVKWVIKDLKKLT